MHVPDGFLDPAVCITADVFAAGAVAYSAAKLRSEPAGRVVPLTAMTAAVIFAGQMVNFPLLVVPVSGHLAGGVLAGTLLGPWAGCLALTAVLMVQCLLFADGGLLALGVNILNMAIIGAVGGGLLVRFLLGTGSPTPKRVALTSAFAAWAAVVAGAGCFAVLFALSHGNALGDLQRLFGLLIAIHVGIGLGEAVITGLLLHFVLRHRLDLLTRTTLDSESSKRPVAGFVGAGCLLALTVAALLSPLASASPDGLEAVAERQGFAESAEQINSAPLPEYAVPLPDDLPLSTAWTETLSGVLAGLAGTFVFVLLAACAWWRGRNRSDATPSRPVPSGV